MLKALLFQELILMHSCFFDMPIQWFFWLCYFTFLFHLPVCTLSFVHVFSSSGGYIFGFVLLLNNKLLRSSTIFEYNFPCDNVALYAPKYTICLSSYLIIVQQAAKLIVTFIFTDVYILKVQARLEFVEQTNSNRLLLLFELTILLVSRFFIPYLLSHLLIQARLRQNTNNIGLIFSVCYLSLGISFIEVMQSCDQTYRRVEERKQDYRSLRQREKQSWVTFALRGRVKSEV